MAWLVCVEVTLSVQDLVCDVSRGVSVGVGFVDVVVGVRHLYWFVRWWCSWFWLSGWALVG